jgi:hypothetical protein
MEALGGIAILLGMILILVGAITFIIAAFQESILWGIGVLVFPVLQLVFLIVNWQRAKGPFILQLYGIGLVLVAVFVLHHRFPFIHGHLDF